MNSTSRVQWLTEDEFQILKDKQIKDEGIQNPPDWQLREGDFPQLNCLYEHAGEKTINNLSKKNLFITETAQQNRRWKKTILKQSIVWTMAIILATSRTATVRPAAADA